MDKYRNEKRLISPNKITLPLHDKENGVLEEYIQTTDKDCQENFTCSICSCLAWDPIFCPKCDKPFCRACITSYEKSKICPFNCEINAFREITRMEKNYLNKIKLKCTNVGCSKYIQYNDYIAHLEECNLRKYHCKNYPCKEEGYINDMITHSKNCPHRISECQKCKQNIKFCEMKVHQRDHCPEILVKCKLCKCSMKRRIYLKEHFSENNENVKCLKMQVKRWSLIYNEDMNIKNNEIADLKNKIKEMEAKQKVYESENLNLKKNLEEIKYIFKKTYNKFFAEENRKVFENELNINNKRILSQNSVLKYYINNGNNLINKNYIYKKDDKSFNNISYTDKKHDKSSVPRRRKYSTNEETKKKLFGHGRQASAIINSPKAYSVFTYNKRLNKTLK